MGAQPPPPPPPPDIKPLHSVVNSRQHSLCKLAALLSSKYCCSTGCSPSFLSSLENSKKMCWPIPPAIPCTTSHKQSCQPDNNAIFLNTNKHLHLLQACLFSAVCLKFPPPKKILERIYSMMMVCIAHNTIGLGEFLSTAAVPVYSFLAVIFRKLTQKMSEGATVQSIMFCSGCSEGGDRAIKVATTPSHSVCTCKQTCEVIPGRGIYCKRPTC